MYSHCHPITHLLQTLAIIAAFASPCSAQEVASIDLTEVAARIDLRRPQATSPVTGGYHGYQDTRPCFDTTHNAGTLRTSLVSLDRIHYQVGDEPRFEVTFENTGSAPIRIPVSPHLADLQPTDPAQEFAHYELQIALWIAAGGQWDTNAGGSAILYGADDHANTMLTLDPGEWVRIIAKGDFDLDEDLIKLTLSSHPADQANAQTSLFREETLITPTQSATMAREVCMAKTQGQPVPIQLSAP
jgi:hypothetical protein